MDTSGNYYNLMTDSKHHVEEPRMVEKQIEELLEEEAAAEQDPCHQRKCTSNEHCCDGMVCVDTSNGGMATTPRGKFVGDILTF